MCDEIYNKKRDAKNHGEGSSPSVLYEEVLKLKIGLYLQKAEHFWDMLGVGRGIVAYTLNGNNFVQVWDLVVVSYYVYKCIVRNKEGMHWVLVLGWTPFKTSGRERVKI